MDDLKNNPNLKKKREPITLDVLNSTRKEKIILNSNTTVNQNRSNENTQELVNEELLDQNISKYQDKSLSNKQEEDNLQKLVKEESPNTINISENMVYKKRDNTNNLLKNIEHIIEESKVKQLNQNISKSQNKSFSNEQEEKIQNTFEIPEHTIYKKLNSTNNTFENAEENIKQVNNEPENQQVNIRKRLDKKTGKIANNTKFEKKVNTKSYKFNRELLSLLVSLTIIYILFRFVFISIKVDGSSMEPTFLNGENGLMLRTNIINKPESFDVVVFKGETNYNEDYLIIKRIIGMPQDFVEIKNNQIYINGNKIDDSWRAPDTILEDLPSFYVPENKYFVLGDNRNNSRDSRSVGLINKNDIIAAGGMIFWPIDKFKFFK